MLAAGNFKINTLEILHGAAYIEREIEHPLLGIAFCSELAYPVAPQEKWP